MVWDRRARIDKIFGSGGEKPASPVPDVGKRHKKRQHKQYEDEFLDNSMDDSTADESTQRADLPGWPKKFSPIANPCYRWDQNTQRWRVFNADFTSKREQIDIGSLKIVSFNVLFEIFDVDQPTRSDERFPAMLTHLNELNPDVVCLQEVTEKFLSFVLVEQWIRNGYFLSQNNETAYGLIKPYGQLIISKHPIVQSAFHNFSVNKRLLVADIDVGSNVGYLRVASLHLTSDRSEVDLVTAEKGREKRIEQLKTVMKIYDPNCLTILAGDYNFSDDSAEYVELKRLAQMYNYKDAWVYLKPDVVGFTFDETRNPLTALTEVKRLGPRRLDRILIKDSERLKADLKRIDILGEDPVKSSGISSEPLYLSDHYGLLLEISLTEVPIDAIANVQKFEEPELMDTENDVIVGELSKIKAVYTSSVCLMPSKLGPLYPLVQRIRCQYDPASDRWPPHINFLYPFLPDEGKTLEKASKIIPARLQLWEKYTGHPLTLTMARFGIFQHAHSSTVILYPDFEDINENEEKDSKILLFVKDPKYHLNDPRFRTVTHIGSVLHVGHPLNLLYKILKLDFPQCGDETHNTLMPHLTIAKFESAEDARNIAIALQKVWEPVVCKFTSLFVMSRGKDTPFQVKHEVPWCSDLAITTFSKPSVNKLRQMAMESLKYVLQDAKINSVIMEFGSVAIGMDSHDSDVDVCIFTSHAVDDVIDILGKTKIFSSVDAKNTNSFFSQSVQFPTFRLWHNASYSKTSFYKLLRFEEATTKCIQMEVVFAQVPEDWFSQDFQSVQLNHEPDHLKQLDRAALKSVSGLRDSQYLNDILNNKEYNPPLLIKFLKLIKRWIKIRYIDSHPLGFPPKIAWLCMALEVYISENQNLKQANFKEREALNQLTFHFLNRFSQKTKWNPLEGCAVAISPDGRRVAQSFFDDKTNTVTKGSQHMCVVGLTYPCSNYCRNITSSTMAVVMKELKDALNNFQKRERAEDIFVHVNQEFFKFYPSYISATVSISNAVKSDDKYSVWPENFPPNLMDLKFFDPKLRVSYKWLESKVVTLILQMEKCLNVFKQKAIVAHPFSQPFSRKDNTITLFLGFNAKSEEIKSDRLEKCFEVLQEEFHSWKTEEAKECSNVELNFTLFGAKSAEMVFLHCGKYFEEQKLVS